MWRDELVAAQSLAQQLVALADEYGFSLYGTVGSVTLGCIAVQTGEGQAETLTLISSGLTRLRAKRFNMYVPCFLAFLAQGYAQLGYMQDALATITEAIHLSDGRRFLAGGGVSGQGRISLTVKASRGQVTGKSQASHKKVQNKSKEVRRYQPSAPNA